MRPVITMPFELHVLNMRNGAQYPFKHLRDFVCIHNGKLIVVPAGFETDFASIPTKWLKRKLEPQKLVPAAKYRPGKKFVVWMYEYNNQGDSTIVGYIEDPVAYAAVVHDWLYSVECIPRVQADRIFFDILHDNRVWSAYLMYAAVRVGGWPSFPHKRVEVIEDRALGREAYTRVLNELDFTVGNEVELISDLEDIGA